jgi:XTP/dITP diphosphohydrolase
VEVYLATRNEHKLAEARRILTPFRLTVKAIPHAIELPPEEGDTFAANALPKARTAARELRRPVIADDSGIEAAALAGRPGVLSARFAGEDATDEQNLRKLMAEAPAGSELRYVCAIAFVDGVTERVFFGESRGHLAVAPRGDAGFGYDPVFLPVDEPQQRTMAELTDTEKDLISHRGRALRDFAWWFLGERLGLRR